MCGGTSSKTPGQRTFDTERTNFSTVARSFGKGLRALRPVEQVGEVRRQLGTDARGALDGVGELGRVGGGQRHDRDVGVAPPSRLAA